MPLASHCCTSGRHDVGVNVGNGHCDVRKVWGERVSEAIQPEVAGSSGLVVLYNEFLLISLTSPGAH